MKAKRPQARGTRSVRWVLFPAGLLVALTVVGKDYYFAPASDRVRSALHPWLRPSGYVGQSAGIIAFLIFLFLWLYPLRKKYRWLGWTGSMASWLDVHVALALLLPVIAAVHASWRFGGVIGLGFWSMMVVWLSGIVGRYLYAHIPRSASGLELSAEEIATERRELIARLATASRLPVAQVETVLRSDPSLLEGVGVLGTLKLMVKDDLARRRGARALRRVAASRRGARLNRKTLREVLRLANQEMALTQQVRMLAATREVFRYWHVVHRPFAIAALAAVTVHVAVVVMMGATWFW